MIAESGLEADEQRKVFIEFEKLGVDVLKPVFEAFYGKVNYDELRLLRLAFVIKNGVKLESTTQS